MMGSPTTHPLVGNMLDARYTLVRLLGQGGMGGVFAAQDQETDQEVALKLLLPPETGALRTSDLDALEKRMSREVRLLATLQDPRIVRMYEWGHDESFGPYYTMELLAEGQLLLDYLQTHQPTFSQRLQLLHEILLGLDVLHQQQIIHRDLKPSNIFCTHTDAGPTIKLIDLGIARWFSDVVRTHMTIETEPGTVLGSPAYMAPEMWRNEPVNARTDIYQIGILGYQLLTDSLPFSGTPHQLMFQHLHSFLPALTDGCNIQASPEALAQVDALLRKATHKDPAQRFKNAQDFADALAQVAGFDAQVTKYEKHEALSQAGPEQSGKDTRVHWLWAIFGSVLALLVGWGWYTSSSKGTKAQAVSQQPLQPHNTQVSSSRLVPVRRRAVTRVPSTKHAPTHPRKSDQRLLRKPTEHRMRRKNIPRKRRGKRRHRLQKPGLLDTMLSP